MKNMNLAFQGWKVRFLFFWKSSKKTE